MGAKAEQERTPDRRSVRLDDQPYQRLKVLAAMQDLDLSEAVDFLFDQLPKVRKAIDEAIASGKKIGRADA